MYKSNKYYIVEICNNNESLGFVDYDHSSGGYPTLGPDYMAHQFFDAYTVREHGIKDIKTIASLKGMDITTMYFKILEYGCIKTISKISGTTYKYK